PVSDVGRVRVADIPTVDLAVSIHHGAHDDIDRTYGSLASYVATHAISLDGPIRETYLTGFRDTHDERRWVDRDRLAHLPPRSNTNELTRPSHIEWGIASLN